MKTSTQMKKLTSRAVDCKYSEEAENIGDRIRKFRLPRSQREFCDDLSKVGYVTSVATISKYETGESMIPSDFLWVLAHYFECDVRYLLTGKEEKDIELRTKISHLLQK
ncbi:MULTISPECIES: helix-turn-helix transcriptional regulator [Clostridia]|jgi:transcriptional regulator with XRE-family HTH domain|uniref:helix-turn-helix domain-containing protein n=1 Tax=Clostridia TaxID=186801 RepID=UPI000836A937|nr:helix-turn-helix transcriptional regulator [Clostridium sp. AT4]